MSLQEHVAFLLEKQKVPKEEACIRGAELAANPSDPKVLQAVAAVVGKKRLGELLDDWTPLPSKTIHLWKTKDTRDSFSAVRSDFEKALKKHTGGSLTHSWTPATKKPRKRADRVHSIKLDESAVHIIVSFAKTLSIPQDDEDSMPVPMASKFSLEWSAERPQVIRTYGNPGDSRKAVSLVFGWLTGVAPSSAKERAQYFSPLRYTEAAAQALASNKKMRKVWIDGLDPTRKNGKFKITAKLDRHNITELDLSDPVVAKHDASPRNVRTFAFKFAHADGFDEELLISFFLTASPPHISFPWGGSRTAINMLVSVVLDICE